ncbi:MAG: hypothetical protein AMXMBFR6_24120 [Betaproteobacteria bacterium]|nr:hypothetical protein [Rhodocyclaceae bacterium]MCG3187461.1 hypothetical protein [Rhodocyclaceae bacterium]
MAKDLGVLGKGFFWEELEVGTTWRTLGRTITEPDLSNFVNLAWFIEELFTNQHDREHVVLPGRSVPGALVYCFAEGLLMPSIQGMGMAFLNMQLDVKGPTQVGDTIYVHCEVIESRPTSKPDRGLLRTMNRIVNQHGDTVITYNPLRMLRRRPA